MTITSYGHSALLIDGGGRSVLLNPFKAVGCAKGLNEPRISANIILASSNLADEGAKIAKGKFLVKPGSYKIKGINFIKKHEKTTKEKKGGIITKENFIDISNIKILDTLDKKDKQKEKK